jgi:DNA polymerase III delta subunit
VAALPIILFMGDPYRCERALAERQQALRVADSTIERVARFADEIDVAAFDMDLQSVPLFALGRHFVVRGVDRARKPKLWSDLIAKSLPESTFLTFVASAETKPSHPLVKACAARDAVVQLPTPPLRSIAQAARGVLGEHGLRLSPAVVEDLVARTGGDLLAIASEARKLRAFAGTAEIAPTAIASLVFPGSEPTVYPFFDRLGERDLRAALRALDELRDDAGRILGGAVRHLARLATLRLLLDRRVPQAEMSNLLRVPDWLLRRLMAQAKRYGLAEAAAALALGIRLDTEVKSGVRSATDALLEFVFSCTATASPARSGTG